MPIITSDGETFESHAELSSSGSYYDDGPTMQAQIAEIENLEQPHYQRLKVEENNMEDSLDIPKGQEIAPVKPQNVADVYGKGIDLHGPYPGDRWKDLSKDEQEEMNRGFFRGDKIKNLFRDYYNTGEDIQKHLDAHGTIYVDPRNTDGSIEYHPAVEEFLRNVDPSQIERYNWKGAPADGLIIHKKAPLVSMNDSDERPEAGKKYAAMSDDEKKRLGGIKPDLEVPASGGPGTVKRLEDAMHEYAKGNIKSKDVQKVFKEEGWTVNLRGKRGEAEAFDPKGNQHWLNF